MAYACAFLAARLPLRFTFEGDVASFDSALFQHALVEALKPHFDKVRKGYFPVDGVVANTDAFDAVHQVEVGNAKHDVIVDLRFNQEDPTLAAALAQKVSAMFDDGSLQLVVHSKLREAELEHKLVGWKIPGEKTLHRWSQIELCKALAMCVEGNEQVCWLVTIRDSLLTLLAAGCEGKLVSNGTRQVGV